MPQLVPWWVALPEVLVPSGQRQSSPHLGVCVGETAPCTQGAFVQRWHQEQQTGRTSQPGGLGQGPWPTGAPSPQDAWRGRGPSGPACLFDLLEMDRLERPLVNLPLLLDPSSYVPDTVDLTDDVLARKYWLTCFEEALEGVVKRAVASQPGSADAAERAEKFRRKYWDKLQTLCHQPFAYGTLTVRSLLDTREHCLNEFNFPDPYSKVKQQENGAALKCFQKVVSSLDTLAWEERQLALVRGLLAGNVFDWGAKAVSDLLESDPHFGFEEAKSKLQERPWLVDTYDEWLRRLRITAEWTSFWESSPL